MGKGCRDCGKIQSLSKGDIKLDKKRSKINTDTKKENPKWSKRYEKLVVEFKGKQKQSKTSGFFKKFWLSLDNEWFLITNNYFDSWCKDYRNFNAFKRLTWDLIREKYFICKSCGRKNYLDYEGDINE